VSLHDIIRSAGGGEFVGTLARQAQVSRAQAEHALRVLLPDLGRAIRRTAESRTGAPAVHAAMRDERYARYLEDPEALRGPDAVADGERVLLEILDDEQREELIRDAAAATDADEDRARTLLPLVAALAMAALGRHLREPSPEIPWFGTDPRDHFDEPLLDALTALFEQDEDSSKKHR
jgi:hypothetical protein